MKMKKLTVFCIFLLSLMSLSAAVYYVGADGGVTFNSVIAGKGYRDYKYDYSVGYKAEVPVVISFNDYLAFESGVSIYGKNYKYSQSVKDQVNFDYTINNGFLSFPFSLKVSYPIKDFSLFLSLGGYMGGWLYGSREGTAVSQNDREVDVSEKTDLSHYNRFDAGIRVRIGAGYEFYCIKVYTAVEYLYSLSDMNKRQKYGSYPIHNSTFALTLGLLYRINNGDKSTR